MGFDPRRWSSAAEAHRRQTVTSNVDALLAENDSLRREVLQLKKQIDVLRQRQWTQSHSRRQQRSNAQQHEPEQKSPSVSPNQVERWGEALARQQGWNVLRLKLTPNSSARQAWSKQPLIEVLRTSALPLVRAPNG